MTFSETKILFLSRLVRTVPCVAAFMSSLTVITVALDRQRVILRPHQTQVSQFPSVDFN